MYQASNISYQVQGRSILKDVSLTVTPGKFTALVGPNGAGKSSLLKLLARERSITQGGAISLNGKPINQYTPRELSLVRAVLPQHSSITFSFTPWQIVLMGRFAHHMSSQQENVAMVEEAMHLTSTWHLKDRNYLTLSGGEKQRVQLARVVIQVWEETEYPRYILLDEPTSSLDMTQQQLIFSLAKSVCKRNLGVLAIIHDLNQAVQFADDLYFMCEGAVVAQGNAREVFTKEVIERTFQCPVNLYHDPCSKCPFIIPVSNIQDSKFNIQDSNHTAEISNLTSNV